MTKKEQHQNLKLYESVVKEVSDAVLITTADVLEHPHGPEIVFVNKAFTEMTGYTSDDIIGKTPRIFQEQETPGDELFRLRKAINNSEHVKAKLLNYKKNGEEFWVEISLSPVFDGDQCTHFIVLERDITPRKNREQLNVLQSQISRIFNAKHSLADSLDDTLDLLIGIGDISIAEIWLADDEKQAIGLTAHKSKDNRAEEFYNQRDNVQTFLKGEGLPGVTWKTGEIQFWRELDKRDDYLRYKEVHALGFKTAYGIPICFDDKVIGVLLMGATKKHRTKRYYTPLLEKIGEGLGSEIDRKQTEEQLNRIFSFSLDIICVAGMDGYFKKVNPAMSRLLGYTQDELLTHPISSFTHPDDRFKTEKEIDALKINQGSKSFQNRYITKAGKVVWLSWTTRTFFEERTIYSIARDITEQKKLELLLRQANKMSKIGGWEYDIIEQTLFWSDITRQIHEVPPGYEPELTDGINFYKEGRSRELIKRCINEAIQRGKSFDVEVQIVTGKGNERWVRAMGDAEIVQSKVKKVYGSFQDIHPRKTAELKQHELSKERERILESIGDAFFAVDHEWTVTYWNKTAEEQLSMPRGDIVGHNLWEVYKDAKGLDFFRQYNKALEEQVTVSFEEYYPAADKWFDVSAYPSADSLSVFFKNITERKKYEQHLRELNKKLKKQAEKLAASNAELEQFAFVASHDLQEPLRMVTSFLTQLEKKYGEELDEKAKRYIWFATNGASRMRQIISDLLNYSSIGRTDSKPESVNMNNVMDGVVSDFRKKIEEKEADIQWNNLPHITADRSSMYSLMSNLVSNALKYHSEKNRPKVQIASRETDRFWQISVSDNGIGISPEYGDKIFQIFQRLHSNDEYSGTGIGLAVCRKIVENHGGKIWVDSIEEDGSTFTFEIPKSVISD